MNKKFGERVKTELISLKKTACIYSGSEQYIIISGISIKDLKNLIKHAEKRHKICKGKLHYVHLSPDVSFLMKGKKR